MHHISALTLNATAGLCVHTCPSPLRPVSLIWPQRGKHYTACSTALGLSNLCCSETSHSISSVDRYQCSLSPLGVHSFSPACLQLFACARPLQIHQVSPPPPPPPLQTTRTWFAQIQRSGECLANQHPDTSLWTLCGVNGMLYEEWYPLRFTHSWAHYLFNKNWQLL